MNEIALRLHEDTKHMERVSPILFMRKVKMNFDDAQELYEEVRDMRIEEGIKEIAPKVIKLKRKSKYRRLHTI